MSHPITSDLAGFGRLLTLQDVVGLTALIRATIYREVAAGRLPRPVKIGRLSRWRAGDVDTYIASLSPAASPDAVQGDQNEA